MAELIGVIQQIIQENMEAMKPTDIVFGTVVTASPISVKLEGVNMAPIPAQAIILSDAVKERTVDVKDDASTVIGKAKVTQGLVSGDKVAMIKFSKGQRFLVVSKI